MAETSQLSPELTDEKARIGSPSSEAKVAIDGFTEEGENLSPLNTGTEQHGARRHSHGDEPVVPEASRGERLKSYKLADFAPLTGREEDWRFTPLKRLRGLDSAPLTGQGPSVTVTGASNVQVETVGRDDARFGSALPADFFMSWPIRYPMTLASPARKRVTSAPFSSITARTQSSSCDSSRT